MSKQDGGPAFPTTPVSHGYDVDTRGFGTGCGPGLSLRDYFAAKAMAGILSTVATYDEQHSMSAPQVAQYSYELADAMLAAREV